ncbi:MAG: DUF3221 domain-containing protein [Arenimonas sp.]
MRTPRARYAMQARCMQMHSRKNSSIRLLSNVTAGLIVLLATACADGKRTTVPDGVASFAGRIASRESASILLVADSVQPAGADRAYVRVLAGTRLLRSTGEPATEADLQVGRHVRAWFDGPVMESYPVQATAGAIVIDPQ